MFEGINDPYLLENLYKELHIYFFSFVLKSLKKVTSTIKEILDNKSLYNWNDCYNMSYYYMFTYGLKL